MSYIQKLQDFLKEVVLDPEQQQYFTNEANTRERVVVPFLETFGYRTRCPHPNIFLEDRTSQSTAKRIDLAIVWNQQTHVLVEIKTFCAILGASERNQLREYYGSVLQRDGQAPNIAILTNGTEFQFYTDSRIEKCMDDAPFYTLNLLQLTETDFTILQHFQLHSFDHEELYRKAESSKLVGNASKHILEQATTLNPMISDAIQTAINIKPSRLVSQELIQSLICGVFAKLFTLPTTISLSPTSDTGQPPTPIQLNAVFPVRSRSTHSATVTVYVDSRVLIHSGSKLIEKVVDSAKSCAELRQRLLSDGIIGKQGVDLVFLKDYEVNSPSSAASLLFGSTAGGLDAFVDASGNTLRKLRSITPSLRSVPSNSAANTAPGRSLLPILQPIVDCYNTLPNAPLQMLGNATEYRLLRPSGWPTKQHRAAFYSLRFKDDKDLCIELWVEGGSVDFLKPVLSSWSPTVKWRKRSVSISFSPGTADSTIAEELVRLITSTQSVVTDELSRLGLLRTV